MSIKDLDRIDALMKEFEGGVEHDQAMKLKLEKLGRHQAALFEIQGLRGRTIFFECCSNKTCVEKVLPSGEFTFCLLRFGVARGFDHCAGIALEALNGPRSKTVSCDLDGAK